MLTDPKSPDAKNAVLGSELHELLAVLSLAGDMANGLAPETALRTCIVAVRLAEVVGLSDSELRDVWYATVLRFLGCTAFAREEADAFGGSDVEVRRIFHPVETTRVSEVVPAVWEALGTGVGSRALRLSRVSVQLPTLRAELAAAACDVGRRLAGRLGLGRGVETALAHLHERWDGKGLPEGLKERQVSICARVLHVAHVAEAYGRLSGDEAAVHQLHARAGGHLDPDLVAACACEANWVFQPIRQRSVWDEALSRAPTAPDQVTMDAFTDVFADFIDLKTPHALGHSRRVADLVERSARGAGLSLHESRELRHAGRVHDLGHVAVGNDVWEHEGELSGAQWERVRLHPYHARRALERAKVFAPLARLVAMHHERLDGSGYPHGAPQTTIPFAARLLAVADVYAALREPRAHRPAFALDDAVRIVQDEVRSGRNDQRATAHLLEAIGHTSVGTMPRADGLSDREMTVLCAVARGGSNKQIATMLGISAKTVQHHVHHLYDKIGVRSRAAAALYAVENGLIRLES